MRQARVVIVAAAAIALAAPLAGLVWRATHPPPPEPAPAPPVAASALPAAFQGEWNADPAHCGTGLNDSRLRLSGDRLQLYESGGPIRSVTLRGPQEATVVVSLTGEGESWEQTFNFHLSADGRRLVDTGDSTAPIRQRCP